MITPVEMKPRIPLRICQGSICNYFIGRYSVGMSKHKTKSKEMIRTTFDMPCELFDRINGSILPHEKTEYRLSAILRTLLREAVERRENSSRSVKQPM